MHFIQIFGLHFHIDPVAFTVPGLNWDVYWYGIMIALGFLLAVVYAAVNAKRFNLDFDKILDCIFIVLPVSIIFARGYYMIFEKEPITDFFDFSGGHGFSGLAIYGAVIGAALSAIVACKIFKVDLISAADLTAIGFLIGQGCGRWGNFFNQEAFGTFTGSSTFGMTGDIIARTVGTTDLVHPCFLYESLFCFIAFIVLHFISKKRVFRGEIALFYCVFYGAERFFVEGLRTDSLMLGNLRVSQVLSAVICLTAGTVLIIKFTKLKKAKAEKSLPATAFKENENDN